MNPFDIIQTDLFGIHHLEVEHVEMTNQLGSPLVTLRTMQAVEQISKAESPGPGAAVDSSDCKPSIGPE